MNLTISVTIIQNLVNYLSDKGADRNHILSLLNTSEEFISNPQNRMSADSCETVWTYAEKFTGDACVGLHCGEKNNSASLGLINPLIQSCPDLWTALVKTSDYMNIISEAQRIVPQIKEDKLWIQFFPHPEWSTKHPNGYKQVMACTISFAAKTMDSLAGIHIPPLQAGFNHSLPFEIKTEYSRVLKCMVQDEEESCSLVFDKKYAFYPIQSRNLELMKLLEHHIVETMKKYNMETTFSNTVKQAIIESYKSETPTISSISKTLALSIRNIQRKLKDEDTRFQALVNEIKKELAESYLKNKALSISEISYMLGYAEPAVFTRAYKKWTGFAPETSRNKVMV